MTDRDQLQLIKQYFDTTGVRLNQREKDLLCRVLGNPGQYNRFTSSIITTTDSGRDYRGTWDSESRDQYRIDFCGYSMTVTRIHWHCADGYEQRANWNWGNPFYIARDVREVLKYLEAIEAEL